LLLFADEKPIMVVMSAVDKADIPKITSSLNVNRVRLAQPKEIMQLTGLSIGSIPPFGSLLKTTTYLDSSLSKNTEIAFNAGLQTRSIIMKYVDYLDLEKPILGDYVLVTGNQ
jgi:Ala-tRNA(Pro) deacylase